jgi:predicted kinase
VTNVDQRPARSRPFLLQLAGAPGTGKSRLASAIAHVESAVILDSDTVKSTLLAQGVAWPLAGRSAYFVLFGVAEDLLGYGHSVILDSPSHYAFIPVNGQRLADMHAVRYRFIELVCDDLSEIRRRLGERTPKRSQIPSVGALPVDADEPSAARQIGPHRWETARPDSGAMVLDTGPGVIFETVVSQALDHLRT